MSDKNPGQGCGLSVRTPVGTRRFKAPLTPAKEAKLAAQRLVEEIQRLRRHKIAPPRAKKKPGNTFKRRDDGDRYRWGKSAEDQR